MMTRKQLGRHAVSPRRKKIIALLLAAAANVVAELPASCEEGASTACMAGGNKCTSLDMEYEPPQTGQIWYSHCCTVSESGTADYLLSGTRRYCFSYTLKGYPSNAYHGTKPECTESGSGNSAWELRGQCSTQGVSCSFSP